MVESILIINLIYPLPLLGFKLIQFIEPMFLSTYGHIAFKFITMDQADELKTKLVNKIKELGLEENAPQIDEYTQTICPKCSKIKRVHK